MSKKTIIFAGVVLVAGGLIAFWRFDLLRYFIPNVEEIAAANPDKIRQAPKVKVDDMDWPWWRGPMRNGVAKGPVPPTEWSEKQNILWKSNVPGRGHGSAIVVGNRVFVPTADEDEETMSLLCYDRENGDRLWSRELHRGGFMHTHQKNSHASATPACDYERVFTAFMIQDGIWVSAVDLDGEILWQKKVGPFRSQHGHGSSPVIYKSLVIVAADNPGASYIVALDRKTGDIVWRKQRGRAASFGTPIVAEISNRDQLLLSGQNVVTSYNPASGEELWTCNGPADTIANTMAFSSDHVFASGGWPQNGILCIEADGNGDVTETNVAWKNRDRVYVPSMVADGKHLFTVQDKGIAAFFDIETGKQIWKSRLAGQVSASPVLVGDKIFVPDEFGTTCVLEAKSPFGIVARNELDDRCFSTPAICGGRIYLRTANHLYCIGEE